MGLHTKEKKPLTVLGVTSAKTNCILYEKFIISLAQPNDGDFQSCRSLQLVEFLLPPVLDVKFLIFSHKRSFCSYSMPAHFLHFGVYQLKLLLHCCCFSHFTHMFTPVYSH